MLAAFFVKTLEQARSLPNSVQMALEFKAIVIQILDDSVGCEDNGGLCGFCGACQAPVHPKGLLLFLR